jgi:Tol biopolymer transport system component
VTYNIGHVQVSPDGSRLAFQDDDQIYVTNVDGSETISLGEGSAPWWSPDGEEIVYQKDSAIYTVEVATGSSQPVFDGWAFHPNFSPDGERILFTWIGPGTRGFALWTIPVGGGTPVALPLPHTKHTFPAFGTYSPDGSQIAFRRTQFDGFDFTQMTQAGIWVSDADGSNPGGLGRDGAWMSHGPDPTRLWPTWSPDGTHIAFEPMNSRGIRIVDANSGDVESSASGTNPTWVDDNTLIVET